MRKLANLAGRFGMAGLRSAAMLPLTIADAIGTGTAFLVDGGVSIART